MENTATQSQIERATLTASKSVLSFKQCLAIVMKADAKKGLKQLTKKDIEKMNIRNSEAPVTRHSDDIYAEAMRNQAKAI